MKSSLRKLRGLSFHKPKRSAGPRTPKYRDELLQANQDMLDMRNCYDSLLSAAAASANSAYEFSESLRELGTCLLEKTALSDDEESGRVLLMLGKAQFELQKLIDNYRVHIIQTISTPSESLLKELQTVEEMKRQCDEKRDMCKFMIDRQKVKATSRHTKGESFTLEQLQEAQQNLQEEATLFVFRLKSLKQGQSRSLLTQAARHHSAQLNFFRKGVKSLEVVEPYIKMVAEQQHIDYQFVGDDGTDEEELDDYDDEHGDMIFKQKQSVHGKDAGSLTINLMELDQADQMNPPRLTVEILKENLYGSQLNYLGFNRRSKVSSMSGPLFVDKKLELSEQIRRMQHSSTKKYHTYVLPTPLDMENSSSIDSSNRAPAPRLDAKSGFPTKLWHSTTLEPNMFRKDIRDVMLPSSTRLPDVHAILKEKINNDPISKPTSVSDEMSPSEFVQNTSYAKKIKREAFSGPLTGTTSMEYPTISSSMSFNLHPLKPNLTQKSSAAMKAAVVSSPRINELHELPLPPINTTKPANIRSLIGFSGPLMCRARDLNAVNEMPSNSSHTTSPLATSPGDLARSFSIPSSGPRDSDMTVAKLLDVPITQNMSIGISSPTLMPISLENRQQETTSSESVNQAIEQPIGSQ